MEQEKPKKSKPKKKTLFEDEIDDVFLQNLGTKHIPDVGPKSIGNFFHVLSTQANNNFYKYYFVLRGFYIFCKNTEDSKDIAFMNIKNAFIKRTKANTIQGKQYFSIKFIKKRAYEELFSEDAGVINK